jgi:hypothetical protein
VEDVNIMSDDCLAIGKSIKIGLGGKHEEGSGCLFSEGGTTAKMGRFYVRVRPAVRRRRKYDRKKLS